MRRARFAAEAAAVALGTTPTARRARAVQELLGAHHDATVAADRMRTLAAERPDLAFVCGALAERAGEDATAARSAFLNRRTKLRLG